VATFRGTATCRGAASGELTMRRPISTVPSGLRTAVPVAGARVSAPHWSSCPSRVYTPPLSVTLTVTTLQYGSICHRNVPSGCADGLRRREGGT